MAVDISAIASATPGVIASGGSAVSANMLLITDSEFMPHETSKKFYGAEQVGETFGTASAEYAFAVQYFKSFNNALAFPSFLIIASFPFNAESAYVLGGKLNTTLADLKKAAASTVTVEYNGAPLVSAQVNLANVVSFSDAAAKLQTAFGHSDAVVTASLSGTLMTVTDVASGALVPGQDVSNAAGTIAPGTVIVQQQSGDTGGEGVYLLSTAQTVASGEVHAGTLRVSYNPVSDSFVLDAGTPGSGSTVTVASNSTVATAMKLTAATQAFASNGIDANTPAEIMDQISGQNPDFIPFTTLTEPSVANKIGFAAWTNLKNVTKGYSYILWSTEAEDIDPNATTGTNYQLNLAGYEGVSYNYSPVSGALMAAAVGSYCASMDYDATQGRFTANGRVFDGLVPNVSDDTIYNVLKAKGINSNTIFGAPSINFTFYEPGRVTGKFLWLDSYLFNTVIRYNLQVASVQLMTSRNYIPYNTEGYAAVNLALGAVAERFKRFGAITQGVQLGQQQQNAINTISGSPTTAKEVIQNGYAIILKPATDAQRAERVSGQILFFYSDGQSIQKIAINTQEVQ